MKTVEQIIENIEWRISEYTKEVESYSDNPDDWSLEDGNEIDELKALIEELEDLKYEIQQ
jgi:hypothetical protein